MTNRKFAMVDHNNVVVAVLPLNGEDPARQGTIAGLLSNPECFEVLPSSKVKMGWKYIDGVETETI
jgi:hypothetical protein